MEAYYLSYSGAMMGLAAITQDNNELLKEIKDNNNNYNENVELGEGTIEIQASKSSDDPYKGWVEITAESIIPQKNSSAISILYVDPENPNNRKWKDFKED